MKLETQNVYRIHVSASKIWPTILCWLCIGFTLQALSGRVRGETITGIQVDNQSSVNPPEANRIFETESTLSTVTETGNTAWFTHRMAVRNWHEGLGAFAGQANKRNVIYQIDFTVNDPLNLGFHVDLENVIRGITTIAIGSNPTGGLSVANGLQLAAFTGDSAVPANALLDITGGTDGLSPLQSGTAAVYDEFVGSQSLGSYQGTTSFSLFFTSVPTPTTQVAFANQAFGIGEVIYGLGSIPSGFEDIDIDDLGHFLTVKVTYVPEPATLAILLSGVFALALRRRLSRE